MQDCLWKKMPKVELKYLPIKLLGDVLIMKIDSRDYSSPLQIFLSVLLYSHLCRLALDFIFYPKKSVSTFICLLPHFNFNLFFFLLEQECILLNQTWPRMNKKVVVIFSQTEVGEEEGFILIIIFRFIYSEMSQLQLVFLENVGHSAFNDKKLKLFFMTYLVLHSLSFKLHSSYLIGLN